MLNQKFIKLIDPIEVKVLKLNFKTFLIIKNGIKSIYVLVPTGLNLLKCGQVLSIQYNNSIVNKQFLSDLTFFYSKLTVLNNDVEKVHTKKLLLKGLGLKATLLVFNSLELKLGFSHSVIVRVPVEIKVSIIKNILIVESFDQIMLGNFAATIKNLRKPDSYKGKGISYKNEVLFLKTVKKA